MNERKSPDAGKNLDERLRRFREGRSPAAGTGSRHSGLGLAMRVGVELVAALAIGVGLGYMADSWLGTLPLFSLLGFLFGSAAGMLNVYRTATGQGSAIGFGRRPSSKDDRKD